MFLNDFPVELQLVIVQQLDRDTLKSLRCSNTLACSVASTVLFETIHVSPNTNSFNRARQVASSLKLAPLVKSIIYHIAILEEVQSGFESFRVQVLRLDPTNDVTEDIIWKYNCFLEEIGGQQEFEDRDEDGELQDLCENFINLEAISTVLDEYDDPFSIPDDYVGRRTGAHAACSAEGPHFSSLFNATAGKKLQHISALSASWHCLPRIKQAVHDSSEMLARVKDLRIGLDNSEFLGLEAIDQEASVQVLQDLLHASYNVQYLHLDFDEVPFGSDAKDLFPISHCLRSYTWSSLVKLDLMGIAATEDDFVSFLQKHSQSLRYLHLDDIEIVAEQSSDHEIGTSLTPGSILSLFHRISQTLTLKSATLTGNFTNRHDEAWYVDTEKRWHDSLITQIEKWLTREGSSPLPSKILDRHRKPWSEDYDDTSDISSEEGTEDDGCPKPDDWYDESWVWCPELA